MRFAEASPWDLVIMPCKFDKVPHHDLSCQWPRLLQRGADGHGLEVGLSRSPLKSFDGLLDSTPKTGQLGDSKIKTCSWVKPCYTLQVVFGWDRSQVTAKHNLSWWNVQKKDAHFWRTSFGLLRFPPSGQDVLNLGIPVWKATTQ